jgi:hypothetical protein
VRACVRACVLERVVNVGRVMLRWWQMCTEVCVRKVKGRRMLGASSQ